MGWTDLGGDAGPEETDDVENLTEDEVAETEFLAELVLAGFGVLYSDQIGLSCGAAGYSRVLRWH
ncbi:MAG TPA: hypothetical protein VGK29_02660 [Paludibaculum sp.]|jgi:hypothetical protein